MYTQVSSLYIQCEGDKKEKNPSSEESPGYTVSEIDKAALREQANGLMNVLERRCVETGLRRDGLKCYKNFYAICYYFDF